MSRRVGQANSDQSREIATSDLRVLNPCSQEVSHAFNFDQSQVKSHEGLACVRVWVLQERSAFFVPECNDWYSKT